MFDNHAHYRSLFRIRRFEETILESFSTGVFRGTTHTCIGQEANAVGVLSNITADDIVVSNHRSHGHFLAYGGDMRSLFAELMGKKTGVCGGRGGSQHLQWLNFYSNGVLGGTVPIATGMAFAEKLKRNKNIVVSFIGDGTLGQGVFYESINMAGLWKVPILIVLENNYIAQTTPIELNLAGSISLRFHAFDIPAVELDTSDLKEIVKASKEIIKDIRQNTIPQALILHTYRFGPHSKGDDTRNPEQIIQMKKSRDPIDILSRNLSKEERQKIENEVISEVETAYMLALKDPYPE